MSIYMYKCLINEIEKYSDLLVNGFDCIKKEYIIDWLSELIEKSFKSTLFNR